MAARKRVDIERLVDWTYRLQKAHLIAERGVGLYEAEAAAEGIDLLGVSQTGICERIGLLGCIVDRSGGDSGDLHDDAWAVHQAVGRLNGEARAVVILYARTGSRPPWGEGLVLRFEPVWKRLPRWRDGVPAKGSYEIMYDQSRHAIGCQVRVVNPPGYIEALRQTYGIWHGALGLLFEWLKTAPLKAHEVDPLPLPGRPWGRGA